MSTGEAFVLLSTLRAGTGVSPILHQGRSHMTQESMRCLSGCLSRHKSIAYEFLQKYKATSADTNTSLREKSLAEQDEVHKSGQSRTRNLLAAWHNSLIAHKCTHAPTRAVREARLWYDTSPHMHAKAHFRSNQGNGDRQNYHKSISIFQIGIRRQLERSYTETNTSEQVPVSVHKQVSKLTVAESALSRCYMSSFH